MRFSAFPYGPHAVVLRVNEEPSKSLTLCLQEVARKFLALPFVVEARISYQEILVRSSGTIELNHVLSKGNEFIENYREVSLEESENVIHKIWVSYTGMDMPFLEKVTGLSVQQIVKLHTSQRYTVHALGFQPGFAFLGTLPKLLHLPRRTVPRAQVPANSVAIAADQTAIYPHESPGGWHILGYTKRVVFDAESPSLSIFKPGDSVQFLDLAGL